MLCAAPEDLLLFLNALTAAERKRLLECWRFWSRPDQLPPEGPWRTWVLLGGRGAGKTRAGAEWVRDQVSFRGKRRVALIGPTLHDVREVMIEGPSGLCSLAGQRPHYEVTRRRLVWPNGAEAHVLSGGDPESFRGPQFDAAWADEVCLWARAEETLATLRLGLRLGEDPRLVVTTTPRPTTALKALLLEPGAVRTSARTRDNAANLALGFIETVETRWAGTSYGRQELDGELIEDPEGALWRRADIEARRASCWPALDTIVVGVDPPAGIGRNACGIVAVGCCEQDGMRRAVVLADASVHGLSPQGWAGRAAGLAVSLNAARIVAEANNGGEMVRTVLQTVAPEIAVRLVHASQSKRARAEPIAALYEQGRIAHAAVFPGLEDEMCAFGAEGFNQSPERVDALVWALWDLMIDRPAPRMRAL